MYCIRQRGEMILTYHNRNLTDLFQEYILRTINEYLRQKRWSM